MSASSSTASVRTGRRGRWLHWHSVLWAGLMHLGLFLAPFWFSWSGLVLCLGLYCLTALGITLGYHRLLTHRSFRTPRWLEYLLATLGSLANQGGPLQWVSNHRLHHQHSDADGDPHSPRDGLFWSHLFWWMPYLPSEAHAARARRYAPDLARDPFYCFLQRWEWLPPVALGVLLFLAGELAGGLGISWVLYGLCLRTTLLLHATWLVNSAAHHWGYRSHATRDASTNLWWVALLTFGEGWHNNHHAFPRSARHGLRWWELDLSYLLIRLLSFCSLARHIHVPGKVLCQSPAGRQADVPDDELAACSV